MKYYIVDVFTNEIGKGSPVAVFHLTEPISGDKMLKIADLFCLPETAFLTNEGKGRNLRCYSVDSERDVSCLAAIASSFAVSSFIDIGAFDMRFYTKNGIARVTNYDDTYDMLMPKSSFKSVNIPRCLGDYLTRHTVEAFGADELYLLLDSEEAVSKYQPDYDELRVAAGDRFGVVLTSSGSKHDFVLRHFCPDTKKEIQVSDHAHCILAPYWMNKYGKPRLISRQLSMRGGTIYCNVLDNGVNIGGHAVLFLEGELSI